jgi:hypothetical protein
MTVITVDTEFLDDGKTIELISLALVSEGGHEYYAIVEDADWPRILRNRWLANNVVLPHLPIAFAGGPDAFHFEESMPDFGCVRPRAQIAYEVERWLKAFPEVETWAHYSATDHVAMYQLFGPMIEATAHGWPMRTSCLKQEEESMLRRFRRDLRTERLSDALMQDWNDGRPVQDPKTEHHALFDAKHDMDLARWLGVAA